MQRDFPDLDVDVDEISPTELKHRLDDGEQYTVLDTRRPEDFEAWTITHRNLEVVNVPFTAFLADDGETPAETVPDAVPRDVPPERLVTCCAVGVSSFYVAAFLTREGLPVLALTDGMEGWAGLHEYREVPVDSDATVFQFHRPSSGCLSYLFISGDEAAAIDPLRAFATEYGAVADERGVSLEYALDTHVHADHVSGVREVGDATGCDVVLPAGATDRGLAYDATLVEAGETLSLGDHDIEVVALPGHTTEMVGYRFAGAFATGDTLFLDSVARPDLEDPEKARQAAGTLWETLQGLASFPDDLVIAPAHVGPTTAPRESGTFTAPLGELRSSLQAFEDSREAFIERVLSDLPPRPPNFEEIIEINLGQATADSEEAFELELGPNNCAVSE